MFATRIKPRPKPLLVPSLQKYKGLIRIQKGKIPDMDELFDYNCCLLVENYQDENGRTIQVNKMQFIHKTNGRTFALEISDIAYSHSAVYQLIWRQKELGDPFIRLGDQIGISLSVSSLQYKPPSFEVLYPNVSVLEKKQNGSRAVPKLKFLKNKALDNVRLEGISQKMRIEYLKDQTKMDWGNGDQMKAQSMKNQDDCSQFGSDIECEEKVNEVCQIKSRPKIERQIINKTNNSINGNQRAIDYCQSMRNLIKTKLIDFFRNYENHMKKIPVIRQQFLRMNYNIPQKPLKQLIAQICTSHLYDRIKGYQLKSIFLTPQNIEQRRRINDLMQNQTAKERKKSQKKAPKKGQAQAQRPVLTEEEKKMSLKELHAKYNGKKKEQ